MNQLIQLIQHTIPIVYSLCRHYDYPDKIVQKHAFYRKIPFQYRVFLNHPIIGHNAFLSPEKKCEKLTVMILIPSRLQY